MAVVADPLEETRGFGLFWIGGTVLLIRLAEITGALGTPLALLRQRADSTRSKMFSFVFFCFFLFFSRPLRGWQIRGEMALICKINSNNIERLF